MPGLLERLLASVVGDGSLPAIPPVTPRRLVTGNAQLDAAFELMPLAQRRKIQQLRDAGKLAIAPLPGVYGQYDPAGGLVLSTDTLERGDDETARTLTHEATHAMQPDSWVAQLIQQTLEALPPAASTGVPYLDRPREREAFLMEQQVQRARRRY